jgi:hypothetical protein
MSGMTVLDDASLIRGNHFGGKSAIACVNRSKDFLKKFIHKQENSGPRNPFSSQFSRKKSLQQSLTKRKRLRKHRRHTRK